LIAVYALETIGDEDIYSSSLEQRCHFSPSTMPLASLQLEYPITRNFPGRTFSYATFAGAGVVLLFLALVNGASSSTRCAQGLSSTP
jgi:hypothetical protein